MDSAGRTPTTGPVLAPGDELGRYRIRSNLGSGGMGVVYAADDLETGRDVALKLLRGKHPKAIAAFKREFRALADLSHPNLVLLHELVSMDPHWFFTMELVDGVAITDYVRRGAELDVPNLRESIHQLAEGIAALHDAGKLHRDIKPSNVLVTQQGRVVLLDFGLVTSFEEEADIRESSRFVVGTAAYVSPEQAAASGPIGPSSDWYSVGVILYEALAGKPPFTGALLEILTDKQEKDPPPPSAVARGVPEDLDALCVELISRDPHERPSGADVLRRLAAGRTRARRRRPSREMPFVGRRVELRALEEAFATSRHRCAITHVRGQSGIGKSALVSRFLERVEETGGAAVLSGRCYERESLPYKGFDTVIDALSRHLKQMQAVDMVRLVPPNVAQLAQLFPALQWIEGVDVEDRRAVITTDRQERRRRAFSALREVLRRLAEQQPVAISLDDIQWADADSIDLLNELIRQPHAPCVLWLLASRSGARASEPLQQLLELLEQPGVEAREIQVRGLDRDDAAVLASQLLRGDADAEARAATIAAEAAGNPYLVAELVQVATDAGAEAPSSLNLDDVIGARIARLPDEAQRLLRVVAVAARPVEQGVAIRAAELDDVKGAAAEKLRGARLARTGGARDRDPIECFHDRIRETVVARLSPAELRDTHRRLARAMEQTGRADAERLAEHFHAAGDRERAASYAQVAALRAAASLAFDRAARLYRLAIELSEEADAEARLRMEIELANALAGAGRGAEAAHCYLAAARRTDGVDALELQRRAADQFLCSGHIDEGLDAFAAVLEAGGLELPATPKAALWSIVWGRFRNRLRGLRFRERNAASLAPELLIKIDTCYSLMLGLATVDPMRAMAFQTKHVQLCLNSGEPYRISRALSAEASYLMSLSGKETPRVRRLMALADSQAERVHNPHAAAFVYLTKALCAFHEGRWMRSKQMAERAVQLLSERCTGVSWEVATAQTFYCWAVSNMGQIDDLRVRVERWLREAQERDNLYATTMLRYARVFVHIADDEPESARAEVRNALAPWSQRGFLVQHWNALQLNVLIDHYTGNIDGAWRRIQEAWPSFEGSLLNRIEQIRIIATVMYAATAIGVAAHTEGRERNRLLARAAKLARSIIGAPSPWARPMAVSLQAQILFARDDVEGACGLLASAARGYDDADMPQWGAGLRRTIGKLRGGDAGAKMVAAAERELAARKLENPDALGRMFLPGMIRTTT